jgi:DNA-binding GntR family transcriptional regulator
MNGILLAAQLIREQLAAGVWQRGERLPSLELLARRCSVSRTTMWRAVGILQKELLLHARKGGAIIAGKPGMVLSSSDGDGLLWERIKVRVGQDLHLGYFKEKSLPLVSKLSLHYGVSTRTLRKALDALVEEGLLAPEGRRYVQVRGRSPLRRATIAFVNIGSIEHGINAVDPRSRASVESFERECFSLGYASRLVSFESRSAKGFLAVSSEIKRISEIAGFIVNVWNPGVDKSWQSWIDLLLLLLGYRVPVVLLDQSGDLVFPVPVLESPFFRVLRISSERSGEMAGEVLLRTGCYRVAYITPFYSLPWARARHAGLVRHFERYSPRASKVDLFAFDQITNENVLVAGLLSLDTVELNDLLGERLHKDEIAGLIESLTRNPGSGLPRKTGTGRTVDTLRYLARSMIGLVRVPHDRALYELMMERFMKISGDRAVAFYLKPLFDRALKNAGINAWVCSDEKTALSAFSYLSENGKRIPEDISIISFDNWRESYEHQLTTYDFNMNGMVQQALLMIVDEKTLKKMPAISEVQGYVVERRSTRR